jgi:hypothetical protein
LAQIVSSLNQKLDRDDPGDITAHGEKKLIRAANSRARSTPRTAAAEFDSRIDMAYLAGHGLDRLSETAKNTV